LELFGLILLLLILSSTLAVNLVRFPLHPVTTAVLCTPELDEGISGSGATAGSRWSPGTCTGCRAILPAVKRGAVRVA